MEKKQQKSQKNLRFKGGNRDQVMLPSYLDEWIDKDHPVRLIDVIVDDMNIDEVLATYQSGGAPIYHPRVLLKILFYGYLNGHTSSRVLEMQCRESMPYMWLTGLQTPDHVTISNFRSSKLQSSIDSLFTQLIKRLYDEELVKLKTQTVDGTKIEGVPNRYTYVWRKNVERHKGKLEEKIRAFIAEIDEEIANESSSDGTPDLDKKAVNAIESKEVKKKVGNVREKRKSIDKQLNKKLKELSKCANKLEEYEVSLEILGDRNSYSKTDHHATFMRMKEDHTCTGQVKPSYNIQASSENTYITHISAHQNANDGTCYQNHTDALLAMLEEIGLPSFEIASGDAGYGNEENYVYLDSKGIESYLQYSSFRSENSGKQAKNKFNSRNWLYNKDGDYYTCPAGSQLDLDHKEKRTTRTGYEKLVKVYVAKDCNNCSFANECVRKKKDHIEGQPLPNRTISRSELLVDYQKKVRENLKSDRGKELRRFRGCEIETVFGDLKGNQKFRRFTHTTLPKVEVELKLYAIGYNLRKMYRALRKKAA